MNYTTNLVTRDANEFKSSIELQGNGLSGLSSRSVVEVQLPCRLSSDLEENFTSTEESSGENLNLLGKTEVDDFPRNHCIKGCGSVRPPLSSADFPTLLSSLCSDSSALVSLLSMVPLHLVFPPSRSSVLLSSSVSLGHSLLDIPMHVTWSWRCCAYSISLLASSHCRNIFIQKGFLHFGRTQLLERSE